MLQVFKGAKLYVVSERKTIVLDEDIELERVQKHEGHVRFPYKELTVALTYADNKKKYKFHVNKKQKSSDSI